MTTPAETRIAAVSQIVATQHAAMIDGYGVDVFTAMAIMHLSQTLSPEDQGLYHASGIVTMAQIACQLLIRVSYDHAIALARAGYALPAREYPPHWSYALTPTPET